MRKWFIAYVCAQFRSCECLRTCKHLRLCAQQLVKMKPQPNQQFMYCAAQLSSSHWFFQIEAGRGLYRIINRLLKCKSWRRLHCHICEAGGGLYRLINGGSGRGLYCCIDKCSNECVCHWCRSALVGGLNSCIECICT